MKELASPTHSYKIVARALKNFNCKGKRKYNKALEVHNKYYLYEYGRVSSTGENKKLSDTEIAQVESRKRKCQDDGTDSIKKLRLS